jgi:SP family sugar:H+ symporter-like MFS transporter
MIYETKGLSLEQVDELYAKVGKAWQSKSFVPTVSFQEVQDAVGHDGARSMSLVEAEEATHRRKSTVGQHEYVEKHTA